MSISIKWSEMSIAVKDLALKILCKGLWAARLLSIDKKVTLPFSSGLKVM